MRLFALATMLALGAVIGLSPANAQRGARPPKVTNVNIAVTFAFHSEIGKVRTIAPPDNFDEKGKPKKYTKAELDALRGDTPAEKKLKGYKAEFSDLQVGDTVEVAISMLKGGTKPAKKENKEEADTDKPAKDSKPAAKTGKWIVTQQLLGKVTKINNGKTDAEPKVTIQITTRVLGGSGGTQKTSQNFDPEKYKATLILIGQRPPAK
jgi:hypothetical protein